MLRRKFVMLMGTAAVAAMSGSMLAGCSGGNSGSNDAAPTEGDASAQTDPSTLTTFIVGFDQSYPPYGFVGDDGEFTGFDLDLAAEVCSRNGWTLQLEAIEWDAKDT